MYRTLHNDTLTVAQGGHWNGRRVINMLMIEQTTMTPSSRCCGRTPIVGAGIVLRSVKSLEEMFCAMKGEFDIKILGTSGWYVAYETEKRN